jgi:glycine betaine/proline transport system ATP-binding protein
MGLSGSGKSTLVRCMSRLIEPTAGSILFEDEDLLAVSEARLIEIRRHKMGMVFQHFALLPHLTVLGNVAFPLEVQGVDRARRERRALEMIELVGLRGREDYYPGELSGGQQQRVGIARSLAVEPEVWFLDEPFSALDPLIRTRLQDELLDLQRSLRKTIIFVSHDLDEAMKLGSHIAIMEAGRIVQYGEPEDIVLNPSNEYVADFVAHMNPLNVLTGTSPDQFAAGPRDPVPFHHCRRTVNDLDRHGGRVLLMNVCVHQRCVDHVPQIVPAERRPPRQASARRVGKARPWM